MAQCRGLLSESLIETEGPKLCEKPALTLVIGNQKTPNGNQVLEADTKNSVFLTLPTAASWTEKRQTSIPNEHLPDHPVQKARRGSFFVLVT